MCGITGILLSPRPTNLGALLRHSLQSIQHRGYDGAGLALNGDKKIVHHKGYGLISDVLTDEKLSELHQESPQANYGVAHTRYKTVGECSTKACQPIYNDDESICLVHNGQIEAEHCFPDSTYLLEIFAQKLKMEDCFNWNEKIFEIVHDIFLTVRGSYSCLLLIQNYGLVAFRDPRGIRPLLVGRTVNRDMVFSSESRSLVRLAEDGLIDSFEWITDLEPGECMIVYGDQTGRVSEDYEKRVLLRHPKPEVCIFEYIYLSHPQSVIDGLPVERARQVLGDTLAHKIMREYSHLNLGYVVPIPESSCLAAFQLAARLSVHYLPLLKLNPNRKQLRSFILPTQEMREKAVSVKFILDTEYDFEGKNVLLVDDSIVRGTTLRHLIRSLREHSKNIGNIYVASLAPPIRHKNIYGIDIPDTQLLVAYRRNVEEITKELGADLVIYQDLDEILTQFAIQKAKMQHFEHSMFIEE